MVGGADALPTFSIYEETVEAVLLIVTCPARKASTVEAMLISR